MEMDINESTQKELDALMAQHAARLQQHRPGTPAWQDTQTWFAIEYGRLHGRPIPLLDDPPPPIGGIVPQLSPIPIESRHEAWTALSQGNVRRFLSIAPAGAGLWLVSMNTNLLLDLDGYEQALLDAYCGVRINCREWPMTHLRQLFRRADRDKLRAAGEPLPGPGPYILYRGVAGLPRVRRIKGFSWTSSLETAMWFAHRFARLVFDPQVYSIEVCEPAILAYTNDRQEQEFLVEVPARLKPQAMPLS